MLKMKNDEFTREVLADCKGESRDRIIGTVEFEAFISGINMRVWDDPEDEVDPEVWAAYNDEIVDFFMAAVEAA